jgi:hypothetical protein
MHFGMAVIDLGNDVGQVGLRMALSLQVDFYQQPLGTR